MRSGRHELLELLADRATEGLSDADAARLNELLAAEQDPDVDSLDLTAARIDGALAPRAETELPAQLRAAVLATAGGALGRRTDR